MGACSRGLQSKKSLVKRDFFFEIPMIGTMSLVSSFIFKRINY